MELIKINKNLLESTNKNYINLQNLFESTKLIEIDTNQQNVIGIKQTRLESTKVVDSSALQ